MAWLIENIICPRVAIKKERKDIYVEGQLFLAQNRTISKAQPRFFLSESEQLEEYL